MSASKNVSLSLLVLSVVFCVCLVASNLLETKLVQMCVRLRLQLCFMTLVRQ